MKDYKLKFIEEGLTSEQLDLYSGGNKGNCDSLERCDKYSGNCGNLDTCGTYSVGTAIITSSGPISTNPTGIIT